MPAIVDSTVVASAYTTSASARPVRTTNGNLFSVVMNTTTAYILYKSTDNGATWTPIVTVTETVNSISIATNGMYLYIIDSFSTTGLKFRSYDQVGTLQGSVTSVDITQTSMGSCSLAINDAGTELHASWSSKNATYPNNFNIRYAKGVIAGDGSVAWGTIVQMPTPSSTVNNDLKNPVMIIKANGFPQIIFDFNAPSSGGNAIGSYFYNGTVWTLQGGGYGSIYGNTGYIQSSPSAIFVPQSINGLTNGRIWVAWHGTDSVDAAMQNIRESHSDDGGVTWSAMLKLTSGSIQQVAPTITANKSNEVYVVWYGSDGTDAFTDIRRIKNVLGTWGAIGTITSGTTANKMFPSTLYDPTFNFTEPLFIYQNNQSTKVGFYGTWTITTISVTQGSIGTKSDKSNLLSYAITTDGAMSTITEVVNGVTIGSKTATSGQALIAGLTQAQWDAIIFGKYKDATAGLNTLTVAMGTDVFTFTFDKRLATDTDIATAIKATQDSQTTFLPSVKAKLASAIRAKGGTVNDTDVWDAMVSAVANDTRKEWAKGSKSAVANRLIVTGLTFLPKFIIWHTPDGSDTIGVYNGDDTAIKYIKGDSVTSALYSNESKSLATLTMGGFNVGTNQATSPFTWWAFE